MGWWGGSVRMLHRSEHRSTAQYHAQALAMACRAPFFNVCYGTEGGKGTF
jgi:hypothetical protein